MIIDVDIKVSPSKIEDEGFLEDLVLRKVKVGRSRIKSIQLDRRSIDARGRNPLYFLRYKVFVDEDKVKEVPILPLSTLKTDVPNCIVVGAGPAGYFAAIELIEKGIKPIVLERGKDVRARRKDLRSIQQFGIVNPHSNYCFGEGGAGTYSDGKLYTRSHKRGSIKKVLQLLVESGANEDILIDTHPHIGSNKLPGIISNIRQAIKSAGGEIHFEAHVVDVLIDNGTVKGVKCQNGDFYYSDQLILATGHSARDVFYLLHKKNIRIEPKSFALGVRIEHKQAFIDSVQYNQKKREDNLPASSYSLACQIDGNGVFSFCMCPGGLVVPAATAPGEIVVNGMSLSKRDSPFANSGLVTSVEIDELETIGYKGVFGALEFQAEVEQNMFNAGDGSQKAPAQRVKDFVEGITSPELNKSSYIPGLFSAPLHELLPDFISERIRKGIIDLDKKMRGFMTNNANVIGTESRTSSPIRIPRDKHTLMHQDVQGLFPCGEGAGYAGGILSAAMDGQNVAKAVHQYINQ